MDVTQVQTSRPQALYLPAASPKTSAAIDVSTAGGAGTATSAATDANSGTLKAVGFEAVNTITPATADAEIDKYIADLKTGQSLTVMYTGEQYKATGPLVVTPVDASGLVPGPYGVLYRPGVVNPYGTPPVPGTPEVHDINWGGFNSPQATPQPMQIINDDPTTVPAVEGGEILILPAQDAPSQQSAQQSSETVYTRATPSLTVGAVIVASRAGLHESTDPLMGANVWVRSGWEWNPPSSATPPSTSNPTAPQTSFVGTTTPTVTVGTGHREHAPIINSDEASIVTVNSDGTTTVDENSSTTTAADLSKYVKGFLSRVTFGANGTITAHSSATASSRGTKNALDVTA